MKKVATLLSIVICSLFMSACSQPKLSLYSKYLSTDENVEATISGVTSPNAKVYVVYDKMGMGWEEDIVELETEADKEGNFEFVVDWQTTYTVYSQKNGKKSEEEIVTVKHSEEAKETIENRNK